MGGSTGGGEDLGRWAAGRWVRVVLMENGSVEEGVSRRDGEPRLSKEYSAGDPGAGHPILPVVPAKRRRGDCQSEESGRGRVGLFEKDSRFRSSGL